MTQLIGMPVSAPIPSLDVEVILLTNHAVDGGQEGFRFRLTGMDYAWDLGQTMNNQDIDSILAVQLLIARAGNRDSLGWWDDDALSSAAEYVLQRTFPVAPALAGWRLALEASFCRHQALVPTGQQVVHLYRLTLDNRDRLATRFHTLESIAVPTEPITTLDALRVHLLELNGHVIPYAVERQGPGATVKVRIPPCPADKERLVHRAQTLAWAYLEAPAGQGVIPYCADEP